MKKILVTLLSLAMVFALSVFAFATQSFDPTLDIDASDDGKTITVTMNDLPNGVSAELTIPCVGWEWATVEDSTGKTVASTFGKVDTNPDPDVTQQVDAVTFDAVGGTYTITKSSAPSYGGYYPIVTPEEEPVEKPTETKPEVKPVTPPAEETVTPVPEDTTPVVPDEPVVEDPVVDESPADDATQPDSSTGLWIGIGLVALAAIVVVLAIMAVRKKRK